MNKEEFENKLIELINEYSGVKINFFAIQSLTVSIGVNELPTISLNGVMVKK